MDTLRKALDKVKETQSDTYQATAQHAPDLPGSGDGLECVSPNYSVSQCVQLQAEKLADNRCVCLQPDVSEIEFYKVLRTQILQRTRESAANTLMITSALPGEGKTLTAINLALVFAREFNQTVLLVDADLRQQRVHRFLGLPNGAGLIDYLLDDRPLKDLIVWPGVESLTLISGGRTIRDSTEFLGSPKMKALVDELKSRYSDRYVIFDVPPILSGADALAFAPFVSAVLMVVAAGRTSIHDVHKALDLIPQEKFLGFVLNRYQAPIPGYGKGYPAT